MAMEAPDALDNWRWPGQHCAVVRQGGRQYVVGQAGRHAGWQAVRNVETGNV